MDKQRIKSFNEKGQITSHWGPQEEKLLFISYCNAYFRIILQKKLSDVKLLAHILINIFHGNINNKTLS